MPEIRTMNTLNQVQALLAQDNTEEAMQITLNVLKAEPNSAEARHLLGIINHIGGDIDAAISQIQKALEIEPDHYLALVNLGTILAKNNRENEALVYLQRAVSIKPDNDSTLMKLGNSARKLKLDGLAIKSYSEALMINPNNIAALNALGCMHLQQGDMHRAEILLEKAHQMSPIDLNIITNLGKAYCDTGKADASIAILQKGIKLDESSLPVWKNLRHAFDKLDIHNKSIECLAQICKLSTDCNYEIVEILVRGLIISETTEHCQNIFKDLQLMYSKSEKKELLNIGTDLLSGKYQTGINALRKFCDNHCILDVNAIRNIIYGSLTAIKRSNDYSALISILKDSSLNRDSSTAKAILEYSALLMSMKPARFRTGKSLIAGHDFISLGSTIDSALVHVEKENYKTKNPIIFVKSNALNTNYIHLESELMHRTSNISEKCVFIKSARKKDPKSFESYIFQHIQKCGGNSFFYPLQQTLKYTKSNSLFGIQDLSLLNFYAQFPLKSVALKSFLDEMQYSSLDSIFVHLHDGGTIAIRDFKEINNSLCNNDLIAFSTYRDPLSRLESLFNQFNREGYSLKEIREFIKDNTSFMFNNNITKCLLGAHNISADDPYKNKLEVNMLIDIKNEYQITNLQSIILGMYGLPNIICPIKVNTTPPHFKFSKDEIEDLVDLSEERGLMKFDRELNLSNYFENSKNYIQSSLEKYDSDFIHPYTLVCTYSMSEHMAPKPPLIVATKSLLDDKVIEKIKSYI